MRLNDHLRDRDNSEYVNYGICRCQRQTVPEVHRKADIAGPQRVPPPPELIARFAALGCSSHGECSGAFEPNRIACSALQLEKRIAIAARAMAEIGTLGERARLPGKLTPTSQQLLELRRGERRVGERRDNAGSTVAMLTIENSCRRRPLATKYQGRSGEHVRSGCAERHP